MLYESSHLRLDADDGIATLRMMFPGRPTNALTWPRLREIDTALSTVWNDPSIEILVIRSGLPGGFCEGHDPAQLAALIGDEAAQTEFVNTGQRLLQRLSQADFVSVAFLEGPCLGPGLELASACDYRLAVAGPVSRFGAGRLHTVPPCWGSRVRAWPEQTLNAREAVQHRLVTDAFCERRSKIELRSFLDRLQHHPRKARPRRGWFAAPPGVRLARQRMEFRAAYRDPRIIASIQQAQRSQLEQCPFPQEGLPNVVGILGGNPAYLRVAVEVALRGRRAVLLDGDDEALSAAFLEAVRLGRVTPLEADQARKRVVIETQPTAVLRVDWLLADAGDTRLPFLRGSLSPRTLVTESLRATDSPRVAAWLARLGMEIPVNTSAASTLALDRAAA